jgi:hypothetical protein
MDVPEVAAASFGGWIFGIDIGSWASTQSAAADGSLIDCRNLSKFLLPARACGSI